MTSIPEFLSELRRRRVVRALLLWGVVAFAVLQVYEPVMHGLHLPEWTLSFVVVVLGLGFPVTAALAWIFDLGPGGLARTPALAPPGGGAVPAPGPGGRLRLALLLLAVGVGAAALGVAWFFLRGRPAADPATGASARTPSIAVLPFVDMSAAHDQEWFSDGISEEILNALAQVDGLRVIGRTSSFSLKGHNEDLREVGRRLDAGTVLEGSVRRAGQRVRITAQLIETAGGSHLWSEQFDRDVVDVFAVQGEIARAVVGQLRLKLLPAAAAKTTPTASAAAHDAYLQGVALMRKGSPEGFEQGRDAMQRAVDLDPGYAEAWSGLARARFWAADQGVRSDPTVEFPRAMEAAERAIALEPGKAHGYLARGALREGIFLDWEGARADLERAASLDRQNTDILSQLGGVLAAMGRLGEARPQIEQSVRLDPLSANSHVMLALLERAEGHADRATAAATRAVELAPESGRAARTLGLALLDQRRFTEARDAFHRSPNPLFSAMGDAMVAHALGDVGTYRRVVETLTGNPQALGGAYQIAQVFAYAADRDRALEWLGHAAETRDAGLIYLTYDPLFAPLRGDPRYQALLARLKLPSR